MKIIIGGAGAVGTHLAELLSSEKQDIILMDEDKDRLSIMDSNFDLMTVCASPTSIQALKNAGVDDADFDSKSPGFQESTRKAFEELKQGKLNASDL